MTRPLSPDRSASPEPDRRPTVDVVLDKLTELRRCGYLVYPVDKLRVLHCDPWIPLADAPLHLQVDNYDVVTAGTYRALRPGGRLVSQGTVIRRGVVETEGNRKTWHRGGVAVLRDGTIVVDRQAGGTSKDVQSRFGQRGNPVVQFLGGGAVMVEGGRTIEQEDVHGTQEFQRRRGSGFNAPEMTRDNHVVVGIRDGLCVVTTAMNRSGRQVSLDLFRAGFSVAVKFERGSGFFLSDDEWSFHGTNPTGFGITLAR